MEIVLQILFNSLVSGLLLSLVAVGFSYIFSVTKVFNLAHGAIYVLGSMITWWIYSMTHSWMMAVLSMLLIVTVFIYCIEKLIFLPLSKSNANQSITLISAMGVYVVLINFLAMLFGNEVKVFDLPASSSTSIIGIILTNTQLIQLAISLLILLLVYITLKYFKINTVLNSLADNTTLSQVFGFNTNFYRMLVFIVGSLLCAVSGVLKSIETGVDIHSGMHIALTASVVAILVARLNIVWICLCSIALMILQSGIEWYLNAQWKEGITFFILLVVILFKTEGIISYNLRKDR